MNEEHYEDLDTSYDVKLISEPPAEYNKEKDFTTLNAWQHSRDVKLFFYNTVLQEFPTTEKFDLGSQIRRAAISITANIAEGYGRFHYREGIQFYRISRGSLYELKDHLISCLDLNYITREKYEEGHHLIEQAKISLNGFINYNRRKLKA